MQWCGLGWSESGQGQMEISCECGNELSGSIKCKKTIESLHNWWPLEFSTEPHRV
jgi:hypothetical protein